MYGKLNPIYLCAINTDTINNSQNLDSPEILTNALLLRGYSRIDRAKIGVVN